MIDLSECHVGIRLTVLLMPVVAALSGLAINGHIAMSRHFKVMCDSFSRSSALSEEQFPRYLKQLMQLAMVSIPGLYWQRL